MKKLLRQHGLSLVLFAMFLICIMGHVYFGFEAHNEDQAWRGAPTLASIGEYVASGHFLGSFAENLESEFLQMAFFVWFTIFLYQKGSAESKPLPEDRDAKQVAEDEKERVYREAKLREHPILWRIYENSLTLSLLGFFSSRSRYMCAEVSCSSMRSMPI